MVVPAAVHGTGSDLCGQRSLCHAEDGAKLSFLLSTPTGNSPPEDKHADTGPALVVVNGLANNDCQWRRYFDAWKHDGREVLYWDYRGHGCSPRPRNVCDITVPSQARDLDQVMRTAFSNDSGGKRRVVLVAYSLGTQVALEYCSTIQDAGCPVQVEGVVSILGTSGNVLDALFGRASILTWLIASILAVIPQLLLHLLSLVPAALPRVTYWVMVTTGLGEAVAYTTAVQWAHHLTVMDAGSARAFLLAAQQHCLSKEKLQAVGVPVLVVSGGKDMFSPPLHTARLLRHLPSARHVHLPDASHMGLAGHAAAILPHISSFADCLFTSQQR